MLMLKEPVWTCLFSPMGWLHSGTYQHILYLQGRIVRKKKRLTYSPTNNALLCSAKWKSHFRRYVSDNMVGAIHEQMWTLLYPAKFSIKF